MKQYLYCYTSDGKVKAVESKEMKCLFEEEVNNVIVFGSKKFEIFEVEEFEKILSESEKANG